MLNIQGKGGKEGTRWGGLKGKEGGEIGEKRNMTVLGYIQRPTIFKKLYCGGPSEDLQREIRKTATFGYEVSSKKEIGIVTPFPRRYNIFFF